MLKVMLSHIIFADALMWHGLILHCCLLVPFHSYQYSFLDVMAPLGCLSPISSVLVGALVHSWS